MSTELPQSPGGTKTFHVPDVKIPESKAGEPVWELATLYPQQGTWSEREYLSIDTNRLVELNDGFFEFVPMPTELHQRIVFFLCFHLMQSATTGVAVLAPIRIKLWNRKIREPDVVYLLDANDPRRENQLWHGADFAIEVVSPDDPKRDHVEKRAEYAKAKILEYWIVDPRDQTVTQLTLDEGATEYREVGRYEGDVTVTSVLIPKMKLSLSKIFNPPMPGSLE